MLFNGQLQEGYFWEQYEKHVLVSDRWLSSSVAGGLDDLVIFRRVV